MEFNCLYVNRRNQHISMKRIMLLMPVKHAVDRALPINLSSYILQTLVISMICRLKKGPNCFFVQSLSFHCRLMYYVKFNITPCLSAYMIYSKEWVYWITILSRHYCCIRVNAFRVVFINDVNPLDGLTATLRLI